jgi:hypothetical protein
MTPDLKVRADRLNLDDVHAALTALEAAEIALMKSMDGKGGQSARAKFEFNIGFAHGKLSRVIARL